MRILGVNDNACLLLETAISHHVGNPFCKAPIQFFTRDYRQVAKLFTLSTRDLFDRVLVGELFGITDRVNQNNFFKFLPGCLAFED